MLNELVQDIREIYNEAPYRFFSEHDIHTELARNLIDKLQKEKSLWIKTRDGIKVSRVHHEYPTPFRCYMAGTEFKKFTEDEFREAKKNQKRLRIRRGFFDLVVFNPEYIATNDFKVVTGKNYESLLASFERKQPSALDLAIEVIYYIALDNKPHYGIMKRRKNSTNQDYKKLGALMDFKVKDTSYCKNSAMMFFANTHFKEYMKRLIDEIPRIENVKLYPFYHASV